MASSKVAYVNLHTPGQVMAGLSALRVQVQEQIEAAQDSVSVAILDEDSLAMADQIADWLIGSNYMSEAFYATVSDPNGDD